MERLYHMERHWLANQTVIQLEKTLTDNTDAGAMPSWHDTTANYQTYDIGQIFKHLHDKRHEHLLWLVSFLYYVLFQHFSFNKDIL